MNLYLSHALAAVAGMVIQYTLGWFLRLVVLDQVRARRNGKPIMTEEAKRRLTSVLLTTLTTLGLLGIITTFMVIRQYRSAIECDQHATVQASRDTAHMLDELLKPGATVESRTAAVQRWRLDQDETVKRIAECG